VPFVACEIIVYVSFVADEIIFMLFVLLQPNDTWVLVHVSFVADEIIVYLSFVADEYIVYAFSPAAEASSAFASGS